MYNLKKQGVERVGYYNEADRRKVFANGFRNRTLCWLFLTIAGFIGFQFLFETEFCKRGQALEWISICSDCRVQGCLNCNKSGPNACDICEKGYFFDKKSRSCMDCDEYSDSILCEECTSKDTCTKCTQGYKLGKEGDEKGKCIPCEGMNCAKCDYFTS